MSIEEDKIVRKIQRLAKKIPNRTVFDVGFFMLKGNALKVINTEAQKDKIIVTVEVDVKKLRI